mgnify:CR=1 FL=1
MMRHRRLYGLYERPLGTRRWTRVAGTLSYRQPVAVRVFQSMLLAGKEGMELLLRPARQADILDDWAHGR